MKRPVPWHVPFEQALRTGQLSRMESEAYTRWVKTLPCAVCFPAHPADDPHHPYDVGFGGMGTKVPDYWVIPLCRYQHDRLHHCVRDWEAEHGPQLYHALLTLTRAIYEGILK